MAEGYSEEFRELTERAERLLQRPDVHLPHHRELLRLWCYPSFAAHESWLAYTPRERFANVESPCVVKVTWNRPFDYARFHGPIEGLSQGLSIEPVIKLRRSEVPQSELQTRLDGLASINLPLLMERSIALDGVLFGFESFGEPAVKITWQSAPPDLWRPVVEWASEMRRFLDCL